MNRTRIAILGGLVLAGTCALLWSMHRSPTTTPTAQAAGAEGRALHRHAPTLTSSRTETAPSVDDLPAEATITVASQKVCAGEENLIRVTPGRAGASRVIIDGTPGMAVPVRRQHPGPDQKVAVTLVEDDGTVRQLMAPPFAVVECDGVVVPLRIEQHAVRNAPGTVAYRLRSLDPAAPAITWIDWDFGDNTTADGEASAVDHDYSRRPQPSAYSYFLVTAEVAFADGQSATVRTAVELPNLAARFRKLGVAYIQTQRTPRFPRPQADGSVHSTVTLWHHESTPLALTEVVITSQHADGHITRETVPAADLVGTDALDVGSELTFAIALEPGDVTERSYRILGESGDLRAEGRVSLLRPAVPTAENSTPVSTEMASRILHAREVLGKQVVTLREIRAVEAQEAN